MNVHVLRFPNFCARVSVSQGVESVSVRQCQLPARHPPKTAQPHNQEDSKHSIFSDSAIISLPSTNRPRPRPASLTESSTSATAIAIADSSGSLAAWTAKKKHRHYLFWLHRLRTAHITDAHRRMRHLSVAALDWEIAKRSIADYITRPSHAAFASSLHSILSVLRLVPINSHRDGFTNFIFN